MEKITVQAIRSEAGERFLTGRDGATAGGILRQYLGDQEDLIAAPVDGFRDPCFRLAIDVHLRRIDVGHAEVDAQA
jgi:hypothetical protein